MPGKNILALLQGGDRRTIGRSNQIAALVSSDTSLFPELIQYLWSEDAGICMRAADATEKVTRKMPALLQSYKKELLGLMAETTQQELRWHLAAMAPRLRMNAKERQHAATLLINYLEDRSSIVKTFALQGLAGLAQIDSDLQATVSEILHTALKSGTPAMKARSRKLLAQQQGK
ncbi:MAG TPA: hypothetical protein VGN44_20115 [Candidatus Angelobacter sp.]